MCIGIPDQDEARADGQDLPRRLAGLYALSAGTVLLQVCACLGMVAFTAWLMWPLDGCLDDGGVMDHQPCPLRLLRRLPLPPVALAVAALLALAVLAWRFRPRGGEVHWPAFWVMAGLPILPLAFLVWALLPLFDAFKG